MRPVVSALRLRSWVCSSSHAHQGRQEWPGTWPGEAGPQAGGPPASGRAALPSRRASPLFRQCAAGQHAARAGPVLDDVARAQAEDVVEAAVQGGDVQQPGLGRVAVPHLGEAGAATARMVLAGAAEGFPGREQLGVLELEVLHRHGRKSGHGASFGDDPPRPRARPGLARVPGRTGGLRDRPAPLWRRTAD